MKVKLTKWNIQDHLKTSEDRAFYIEAAIDEAIEYNDPGFLAEALGDVARAMGGGGMAAFFVGVSTGLGNMSAAVAAPKMARRKTAKRRLARV